MNALLFAAMCLLPAMALAAGGPAPLGPNAGKFGDWTAATYDNAGTKICYAFTAAPDDAAVMLTVTERSGARDEVTLSAAKNFATPDKVSLSVGAKTYAFYTQEATAFTEYGHAAIAEFRGKAANAVEKISPATGKGESETFSLNGFSAAYAAIGAACP